MLTDELKPNVEELRDYMEWYTYRHQHISLASYALVHMTPDILIAVTKLFWPDFVVYENSVFRADNFTESSYQDFMRELKGDLEAVEKVMNHVHIADLLISLKETPYTLSQANRRYLNQTFAYFLQCALKVQFPDRQFQVETEDDPENEETVFTFWELR
jgi:hypothetical protein